MSKYLYALSVFPKINSSTLAISPSIHTRLGVWITVGSPIKVLRIPVPRHLVLPHLCSFKIP
jgi:hypothetical protein